MSESYFSNEEHFKKTLKHMITDGKDHLHVVADFDRTLTKAFENGKPKTALISIIQDRGLLGPEFSEQSQKNFDKYHPIEIDPNISLEEKKLAMDERWKSQNNLLLRGGLTRDIIKHVVQEENISLRSGYEVFFGLLKFHNIPLLIMSASGLGYEGIYYSLEKMKVLSDNIDIISNAFIRDEEGKAIAVREPVIHTFNKGETVVRDLPIYEEIKDRKNVILLGDSTGDAHMADGFDYKNILRIGFLNNDTPDNRKHFEDKFDLIILNDGPMDEVNTLLKKICM